MEDYLNPNGYKDVSSIKSCTIRLRLGLMVTPLIIFAVVFACAFKDLSRYSASMASAGCALLNSSISLSTPDISKLNRRL